MKNPANRKKLRALKLFLSYGYIGLRGRALRMLEATARESDLPVEEALNELLDAALALRHARFAPPHWRGLTRREQQIILLVLQGSSDRVIAREMHIDRETVRTHVRNILRKYRAPSRAWLRQHVRAEGEAGASLATPDGSE